MFDSFGTFARQFRPIDGGYLYYPSGRSGGKLVTEQEYDDLARNWRESVLIKYQCMIFCAVLILNAPNLIIFLSKAFFMPQWMGMYLEVAVWGSVSAYLLWASFAPSRLVSGRPDIAPPRSGSQARRDIRAMLNWPLLIFVLLFSGATFLRGLASSDRTLGDWAWLIGGAGLFALYLWTAFQKLRDRVTAHPL